MKKIIFGATLLLCGTIGLISILTLSVQHPWDYNGITGLYGFLLGSQTLWVFLLFCVLFILGIVISFYEAYISKAK